MKKSGYLSVLEAAISDVGYWRWWTFSGNKLQLEFGGVQLYNEPSDKDAAPSGVIALRFENVNTVAFLLRESCGAPLPSEWFTMLSEDRVEFPSLNREEFTLTEPNTVAEMIADASSIQELHGAVSRDLRQAKGNTFLAFWAGNAGVVVVAEKLSVLNHQGTISRESVRQKSEAWWAYWQEYWNRKDSPNPMPEDYACEVTIPAGE